MKKNILTISFLFCFGAMFSQDYSSKENSDSHSENTSQKKNKLYSDIYGIEDASSNLLANDKQRQAESLQRIDEYLNEQALLREQKEKQEKKWEDFLNEYRKEVGFGAIKPDDYKALLKAFEADFGSIIPNGYVDLKKAFEDIETEKKRLKEEQREKERKAQISIAREKEEERKKTLFYNGIGAIVLCMSLFFVIKKIFKKQ